MKWLHFSECVQTPAAFPEWAVLGEGLKPQSPPSRWRRFSGAGSLSIEGPHAFCVRTQHFLCECCGQGCAELWSGTDCPLPPRPDLSLQLEGTELRVDTSWTSALRSREAEGEQEQEGVFPASGCSRHWGSFVPRTQAKPSLPCWG